MPGLQGQSRTDGLEFRRRKQLGSFSVKQLRNRRFLVRNLTQRNGHSGLTKQEILMRKLFRNSYALLFIVALTYFIAGCSGGQSEQTSDSNTESARKASSSKVNPALVGEATDIEWTDANTGFTKSSESGKPMMAFYTTSWCSWCKKMRKETFTDQGVVDKLNSSFVPVIVNGEGANKVNFQGQEMTEREFTKAMQVRGFPTTVFFDSKGEIILGQPGFLKPDQLGLLLGYIGDGAYKEQKFEDYMKQQQG
ncbi:MAG: thioredoxin fold domain-containing protein [candidate division Zixibacteria bacterium]|nr:thioredoxin fold domain-containing protein [candidate division Zixibacteria bacterium]